MKVTAERIPESKVLLRIEIPSEQVQQAIEKTYRDLSRRVRIPGFRPGKAPKAIVERYVGGAETVQQEGIDRLIDESFRQAMVEQQIHPIAELDLAERPEFHPGEPLVLEATVPVAPTVELGDYQSIRLQPVEVQATPEQVNEFVDELREANAEYVTVDRPARVGDHVVIDVLGVAGTVPTLYGPGGEALLQTQGGKEVFNVQRHEHEVNPQAAPEFAPGFDEELVGMLPEAEKRFGLTLPADYPDPDLANQSIVFTVKLHEIKEKHLPELDDEFAKKVGGGDTLEALREAARARIQDRLESEARRLYEESLLEAVVSRSTIEIPEVMIQRQIDSEIDDLKGDLARQRLSWADYLRVLNRSEEAVRADLREPAIRALRGYLVLREIARREGVEVAPDEVSADIEATAEQFGRARNIVRERLSSRDQRDRIEARLLHDRTMERLKEIAQQPAPAQESAPVETAEVPAETPPESPPGGAAEPEPAAAAAPAPTDEETAHG